MPRGFGRAKEGARGVGVKARGRRTDDDVLHRWLGDQLEVLGADAVLVVGRLPHTSMALCSAAGAGCERQLGQLHGSSGPRTPGR